MNGALSKLTLVCRQEETWKEIITNLRGIYTNPGSATVIN